jgi:hypothetical protein
MAEDHLGKFDTTDLLTSEDSLQILKFRARKFLVSIVARECNHAHFRRCNILRGTHTHTPSLQTLDVDTIIRQVSESCEEFFGPGLQEAVISVSGDFLEKGSTRGVGGACHAFFHEKMTGVYKPDMKALHQEYRDLTPEGYAKYERIGKAATAAVRAGAKHAFGVRAHIRLRSAKQRSKWLCDGEGNSVSGAGRSVEVPIYIRQNEEGFVVKWDKDDLPPETRDDVLALGDGAYDGDDEEEETIEYDPATQTLSFDEGDDPVKAALAHAADIAKGRTEESKRESERTHDELSKFSKSVTPSASVAAFASSFPDLAPDIGKRLMPLPSTHNAESFVLCDQSLLTDVKVGLARAAQCRHPDGPTLDAALQKKSEVVYKDQCRPIKTKSKTNECLRDNYCQCSVDGGLRKVALSRLFRHLEKTFRVTKGANSFNEGYVVVELILNRPHEGASASMDGAASQLDVEAPATHHWAHVSYTLGSPKVFEFLVLENARQTPYDTVALDVHRNVAVDGNAVWSDGLRYAETNFDLDCEIRVRLYRLIGEREERLLTHDTFCVADVEVVKVSDESLEAHIIYHGRKTEESMKKRNEDERRRRRRRRKRSRRRRNENPGNEEE